MESAKPMPIGPASVGSRRWSHWRNAPV